MIHPYASGLTGTISFQKRMLEEKEQPTKVEDSTNEAGEN